MKQLTLTQSQIEEIIAHARAEAPLEACGLLGGENGCVLRVYPAVNAASSSTRFSIRPEDLLATMVDMEAKGWGADPLAIYHSHPHGPETPSPTDVSESYYPDSVHIIIAHPDRRRPSLRAFRIIDGLVSEVALHAVKN
jgi:proteasome lid subunit RPN8/RPN11